MTTSASRKSLMWPIGIVVALSMVIGLNVALAYLAIETSPGSLESNPYEQGLGYEKVIQQKAAFKEREWDLRVKPISVDNGTYLDILVFSKQGAAISDLTATLKLLRPSSSASDVQGDLTLVEPGTYRSPVFRLPVGLWLMQIQFTQGGSSLFYESELKL